MHEPVVGKGFGGDRCARILDPCALVPCRNGATCYSSSDAYICGCAPGYDGELCEHLVVNDVAASASAATNHIDQLIASAEQDWIDPPVDPSVDPPIFERLDGSTTAEAVDAASLNVATLTSEEVFRQWDANRDAGEHLRGTPARSVLQTPLRQNSAHAACF